MSTLLSDIEVFREAHSLSEWQFGELALSDRHFVKQLRADREPRRKTVAKVRHFMATYRGDAQQAAA
jgi:hypothetical protein